jgi:hypothetical protein
VNSSNGWHSQIHSKSAIYITGENIKVDWTEFKGATTFSIMTLRTTTFSIMTLSIMTFSKTKIIQTTFSIMKFSMMTLTTMISA